MPQHHAISGVPATFPLFRHPLGWTFSSRSGRTSLAYRTPCKLLPTAYGCHQMDSGLDPGMHLPAGLVPGWVMTRLASTSLAAGHGKPAGRRRRAQWWRGDKDDGGQAGMGERQRGVDVSIPGATGWEVVGAQIDDGGSASSANTQATHDRPEERHRVGPSRCQDQTPHMDHEM